MSTFSGTLDVTIADAQLLVSQHESKQDPYCIVTLGSSGLKHMREGTTCGKEKFRTKTHREGGQHPIWNESHNLSLNKMTLNSHLKVKIYDKDAIKDDYIGCAKVNLEELMRYNNKGIQYFPVYKKGLLGTSIGEVGVGVKFACAFPQDMAEFGMTEVGMTEPGMTGSGMTGSGMGSGMTGSGVTGASGMPLMGSSTTGSGSTSGVTGSGSGMTGSGLGIGTATGVGAAALAHHHHGHHQHGLTTGMSGPGTTGISGPGTTGISGPGTTGISGLGTGVSGQGAGINEPSTSISGPGTVVSDQGMSQGTGMNRMGGLSGPGTYRTDMTQGEPVTGMMSGTGTDMSRTGGMSGTGGMSETGTGMSQTMDSERSQGGITGPYQPAQSSIGQPTQPTIKQTFNSDLPQTQGQYYQGH